MKKVLFILLPFLCSTCLGQNSSVSVEMADALQQNGKIYVVVAVLLIIFAGIVIFLIGMDKKMTKLEKELAELSRRKLISDAPASSTSQKV
jgi:hypothetical protein